MPLRRNRNPRRSPRGQRAGMTDAPCIRQTPSSVGRPRRCDASKMRGRRNLSLGGSHDESSNFRRAAQAQGALKELRRSWLDPGPCSKALHDRGAAWIQVMRGHTSSSFESEETRLGGRDADLSSS